METIKINIERCLCNSGIKPYYTTCSTHKIQREYVHFNILADLKRFYNITKLTKNGIGKACNLKGQVITWNEYIANISIEYNIEKK